MWLDRFSNASTPTSNTPNRYRSPAPPRQPSQLGAAQRNGLGIVGRTSSATSLDLTSSPASSTTSLPTLGSLQRRQTGSALRQEQKPPEDVANPVDVLKNFLGSARSNSAVHHEAKASSSDLEVDFRGLSLDAFVEQDETIGSVDAPSTTPTAHADRQKYQDFHKSISDVDGVLESVETYLANFKAELGQVSAEIESLQARSVQLNAHLDNRRKVEKLLGPIVEEISLSPRTVRSIAEGPIDEHFAKALTEIEARHPNVTGKNKGSHVSKAAEELAPLLNDLKGRAVERIRDYLVAQIKSLRSPNVNAQVIQQQNLLKHKELYPFLARNSPQLAEEIAQAYTNTMRWYYSTNLTRYNAALRKLQLHSIDQTDLLGSDPAARRQNVLGQGKSTSAQHDAFGLGKRADYLKSKDERALPAHLAEDSKMTSYLEVPFRNYNQVLLDNLSAEYSVVTELFSNNTYHQVSRRVLEIFEPSFTTGHNLTKQLVETTTDCLGILICIRLNQKYAFEAQKRKVPVMDDYVNYTTILLWPRFQKAMDMHIESLKKVPVASTARGAAAAFSLVGGGASPANTVAPHPITQRFGQFLHGILSLSASAGDDEPLSHSLSRLRAEYETLMGKLAKGAGDVSKRNRFLYNNYSLVSTIISDAQGKLAEDQKQSFEHLVQDFKTR